MRVPRRYLGRTRLAGGEGRVSTGGGQRVFFCLVPEDLFRAMPLEEVGCRGRFRLDPWEAGRGGRRSLSGQALGGSEGSSWVVQGEHPRVLACLAGNTLFD